MVSIHLISKNKKAFYDYTIEETFEAGIALQGTEVKALREGKVNLTEGWVQITDNEEAFLMQVHIGHYKHGNIQNHLETRPRKLLLQKRQIRDLARHAQSKGYSIVPIKMYLKRGFVKVEIGLGKGKKLHDKRDRTKEREADRDMARAMKKR